MKFLSDILAKAGLVVDGTVTLNSVANATTDTDRFIVVDSGVVKYRTGTQLLSDIGGISGNQTITLSGDATGSGTTAITVTLANSGVAAATYGSASAVPVITVDAKGRVTSVTTASISGSLTFTGDVTGSGTTGTTTTLTLANSGVTAGTYTKVTVDAKGRVTSGTTLSAGDIPTLNQNTTGSAGSLSDDSGYIRTRSGGTEANLDTYVDNGVRTIAFTGYSQHLLSWNVGGSPGTIQQLFHYNTPSNGWRIRNKTDNNTWSSWGYVVMSSSNQGLISGTIATQSWVQSQGYLTSVSDVWVNNSGDSMTGNLSFGSSGAGVTWAANTDGASITFESTGDGASGGRALSNLLIALTDNGDEGLKVTSASAELLYVNTNQFQYKGNNVWHAGNLTNLNQLTNGPGYITSYTETDTLATVTNRGNTTTGRINVRGIGNQSGGNILMGNTGNASNKWSYLTGAHYNADSQPQGFALIGGLSTDTTNAVVIGGNIYEANPATEIQFWTHTATTHNLGGTQRGVINSSGNWGVGTNAPTHRLSVSRSTEAAAYQININNDGGISTGNYTGIRFSQSSDASTELGNIRLHYFTTGATALSLGTRYATQAIYIDNTSDGKVGIGTTNPGQKLVVNGGAWINQTSDYFGSGTTVQISAGGTGSVGVWSNILYLYPYSTNTNTRLVYGYNGNYSWELTNTSGNSRFDILSSTTTVMSLLQAGSVGIGTTSPGTAKLYVRGQGTGGFNTIFEDNTSPYCWLQIKASGGGSNSSWQLGSYNNGFNFYNDNNGAYRVFFGDNGNVGIGTTSPNAKLHVFDSTTVATVLVRGIDANLASSYTLQHGGGGARTQFDGTWYMSYGSAETDFGLSPNLGGGLVFWWQSGATTVNPMTLKRSGNVVFSNSVGIGTASPGYPLHVVGNTFSTGVISNTFWTDDSIRKLSAGAAMNFRNSAGTIEMILNGSGNLGVGVSNPTTGDRVEVGGTLRVHTGNNWDAIQIYADGANGYIQGLGDETGLRIRSQYGNVMLTDDRGAVLIGATTQEYGEKLRVNGGVTTYHAYTQSGTLSRVGNVSQLITTTGGGAGYYGGLTYTAFTGAHDNTFNGSVTIPNSVGAGGINATTAIRFGAANVTVTMTQSGSFRSYDGVSSGIAPSATATGGSISHVSAFHALAPYYVGSNTPTITNYFGLLLNDSAEYSTWVAITNRWGIYQHGSGDNNYFAGKVMVGTTTVPTQLMYVNGTSYFNGNMTVNGTITELSTINIKTNVETLDGALDKVEKMRGVSYNRKDNHKKEIGFIAEEVDEVYPEFVEYDEQGNPVGLHYARLTAVLLQSVKELSSRIKELEKRN